MDYAGFLLRRERLHRNWSQEGLCSGICTVSYLSKIEQGKAEPSRQVLEQLLARMELPWYETDAGMTSFIENCYEALFSRDPQIFDLLQQPDKERCRYSGCGPDLLLLEQCAAKEGVPLEEELELCLDDRQLALQRGLQHRFDEAMRLYPRAYFSAAAGGRCYNKGEFAAALEHLHNAYHMAAQEGCPRIMLHCKLLMGNCCSNRHDIEAMENHYRVARRLANALADEDTLTTIAYNTAATQMELGRYEEAMAYFLALKQPGRMDLHKLAICCEKLGLRQSALDALDRAEKQTGGEWIPLDAQLQMLQLVRLRLTTPDYLHDETYGRALLQCFERCRTELASGFATFHLPWVLEWYEANRQYKQALQIFRSFPDHFQIKSLMN